MRKAWLILFTMPLLCVAAPLQLSLKRAVEVAEVEAPGGAHAGDDDVGVHAMA